MKDIKIGDTVEFYLYKTLYIGTVEGIYDDWYAVRIPSSQLISVPKDEIIE